MWRSQRTKIIIFIGGAALVAASWYGYRALRGLSWARFVQTTQQPPREPNGLEPVDRVAEENLKFNQAIRDLAALDRDLDGLSDIEEAKLGTNPAVADSDRDGLLDRDEIVLFKTNPRQADTDGDGLSDGDEARRGRDPLAAGT